MPTIHVLYDPTDRVSIATQQWLKQTKCSLATMTLKKFYSDEEIEEVAKYLITTLLNHHQEPPSYRGEFGSSPTLLDEMCANPELMKRMEDAIPELSTLPADQTRYLGDLVKIDGVLHVWWPNEWVELSKAMNTVFNVQKS